jgi:hypothetical protein
VFDETLQEVNGPIYDDDFQPGNQLVSPILFHEEDRDVTFNSLERSLLFKDVLDCDLEEYESEIDIMPEKELEFPMLEESIVDILNICLTDDTPELSAEPKYDEYTDDYNIVSLEQFAAGFSWGNDDLQTDAISNEGCLDILFEDDPEQNKLEHAVVFDEACYLKPQDHAIFHDPFADLLDSFNGGARYILDILSQESRKSLKIHDQQHFRWKLSVSFFHPAQRKCEQISNKYTVFGLASLAFLYHLIQWEFFQ